jgi:predicted FMN-binding regulatory protein PaiB
LLVNLLANCYCTGMCQNVSDVLVMSMCPKNLANPTWWSFKKCKN